MSRFIIGIALLGCATALTGAACSCNIPFDRTESVKVTTTLGGSPTCEFDGTETLDDDGNAVSSGDFGVAHYNYEHDGALTFCRVHIVSWTGALADVSKVLDEVRAGVADQGLDPDKAEVTVEDVVVANVSVHVVDATGAEVSLDNVGPYNAHIDVIGAEAVGDAIVVDNPGTGPLKSGMITTSDDSAGLAAIVNAAVNDAASVDGAGHADTELRFIDLPALTDAGRGAPKLIIDADLQISGNLAVGL